MNDSEKTERNRKRDRILEFYYDDLSLAKDFAKCQNDFYDTLLENGINISAITSQYNPNKGMYPLKTKVSINQCVSLANDFFSEINPEFSEYFKTRIQNNDGIRFGHIPSTNVENRNIILTNYGDLRDLYTVVHEFSHLFDSKDKDTVTRNIFTESCAQSMERTLDSYLLNLTDEQLSNYGFNKDELRKDILDRKISTLFTRLRSINILSTRQIYKEKSIDSSYMLAQIYSTLLEKFPYQVQKEKINNIIAGINSDDFESVVNNFEFDLSKNNINRNTAIKNTLFSSLNDYKELNKIQEQEKDYTEDSNLRKK